MCPRYRLADHLREGSFLAFEDILVLRHVIDPETGRVVFKTPLVADLAIRLVQDIECLFANNDDVITARHLIVVVRHVTCLFSDV